MEKLTKESLAKCMSLDAHNLYQRVDARKSEALYVFSSKRAREHFEKLFRSKYYDLSIEAMAMLEPTTISLLNEFYEKMDDLKWYLMHTEDMVTLIEDSWSYKLAKIKKNLDELQTELTKYFAVDLLVSEEKVDERDEIGPPHIPLDESDLEFVDE